MKIKQLLLPVLGVIAILIGSTLLFLFWEQSEETPAYGTDSNSPSEPDSKPPLQEKPPTVAPQENDLVAGEYQLSYDGSAFSINAVESDQIQLIKAVANRLGVPLTVHNISSQSITVNLNHGNLMDVLTTVLPGIGFEIKVTANGQSNELTTVRLVIGELPANQTSSIQTENFNTVKRRPKKDTEDQQTDPGVFLQESWLTESSSVLRIKNLGDIDVEESGYELISAVLKKDPDVKVRIAAMETLGDIGSYVSKKLILEALSDNDPALVVAAIELIDSWADPSVLDHLKPLRGRGDSQIDEALDYIFENLGN
ncbi:HEAT repeat domain-containing protein [Pseudomonadota bacterium]